MTLSECSSLRLSTRLHDLNPCRIIYKIWSLLSGGAPIDARGAQISQMIEQNKIYRQSSNIKSDADEEASTKEVKDGGGAIHENPESATLRYALGVGAVEEAPERAKSPAFDPYAEFDDGLDPYDDD